MTDREQWLIERRKGIGASDAPTVCGIRTRPTRLELYLTKRGELEPDPPNEAMKWGLRLEPLIAEAYTERTGNLISSTQVCVKHAKYPWMMATLDAVTVDSKIVEFKAVGSWAGRSLDRDGDPESLPEPWIVQCQHQMCVAGAERMQLAAFVDMSLRVYDLRRNEDMISDILVMEEEFWRGVQDGTPPAEFAPEDCDVLRRHFNRETGECLIINDPMLERACADLVMAKAHIKMREQEEAANKAAILMRMGNASGAICGPYTLKRKLVNVKERTQVVKASSYVRFTVSNGDEE